MMNKKQEKLFYEELLQIRKSKDIQINEISENTKINIKYIEAIEKGDFDSLPNIYVRLFIRSYAEYLGEDSKSILRRYEEHVNIKPKKFLKLKVNKKEESLKQNKINLHNKTKKIETPSNDRITQEKNNGLGIIDTSNNIKKETTKNISNDPLNVSKNYILDTKYFLSPTKLLKIFSTFSILLIIYLLISHLSEEQRNNITIESEANENNTVIETKEINHDSILSNNDFSIEKLINKKSFKLKNKVTIPYTFHVVTKNKTKIYISHDNESGKRIEDCNIIASKDTLLKFENKKNIYFDLWSAKDVEISINNKPITRYVGNEDVLVRGSFEPIKKELYLEFYSY